MKQLVVTISYDDVLDLEIALNEAMHKVTSNPQVINNMAVDDVIEVEDYMNECSIQRIA